MTNENALETLEGAMEYINQTTNAENGNDQFDAYHILVEAWKAVGPCGQIPSWECA